MGDTGAAARGEAWVRCAWATLLFGAGGLVYLGSHPAGRGPIAVYLTGPALLALAALAVGVWGLVTALVRRPFLRRGRLAGWFAVGGAIALASYPLPFPSRHAGRPSAVLLELPLDGAWRVRWGGDDPARNLPASLRPDRRYGYDLVALDAAEPAPQVHAPCDGRVVAVRQRELTEPDAIAAGLGTHVVLEIARDEYLVLAGLERDSVAVAPDQHVRRGDPLGRVGATAAPSFTEGPHLILFAQDTPELLWGQGIPILFAELAIDGERRERAQPRGQSVRDPAGTPGDVVERVR
jgi:hypothetical protein